MPKTVMLMNKLLIDLFLFDEMFRSVALKTELLMKESIQRCLPDKIEN